jgi:heat shock protein HslJ
VGAAGQLEGTAWYSRRELPSGTRIVVTLAFGDGRCFGSSGCNRFSGSADVGAGSIVLGPLAGTMMACEPEVMDAEAATLAALAAASAWSVRDGTLVLEGPDGIVMELAPAPSGLTGVRWIATGINNGRGGVVSAIPGWPVDAVFGEDETVTGRGGCNRFRGPWSLIGAMLAIGPLATTRMACPDEAVMAQESAFTRAMELATSYERELDRLVLRDAGGAALIIFEAAAAE